MEVNFAFLCDYADQTGGKLSAMGIGFDTIYAATIPVKHPLFFSVISLRFGVAEIGQKDISMHLIDIDGKDILPPLEAKINVPRPPSGFLYRNQNIALALHGVLFPAQGDYTISWLVGGSEVKNIPLRVTQPPSSRTTA